MAPQIVWWHGLAQWLTSYPLFMVFGVPALAGALVWGISGVCQRWCQGSGRPLWVVVGALSAGLFVLLALTMVGRGGLTGFDQALALGFAQALPDWLLQCLSLFTALGNRDWLTGVAVLLILGLLLRRQWRLAGVCAVATGGAGLLTTILKHALQRVRPEHLHGWVMEGGWSFPSGHAAGSLAVYGCVCLALLRHRSAGARRVWLAVVAALICAVGVSRVLLQVHYASDVIAGFSLSLAWVALCLAVAAPRVMASVAAKSSRFP